MLVIKQLSYNYNYNAKKKSEPCLQQGMLSTPPCVTECKAMFQSDAVWSSDMGELGTLI